MTTTTKKINYLNNKDLLKEIHASKISFCSIIGEEYGMYDMIICTDLESFTHEDFSYISALMKDPATLLDAKTCRANRYQQERYSEAMAEFSADPDAETKNKPKQKDFFVDPETIPDDEVVFRIMTFDHIPDSPGRKKKPKNIAETKEKVNFPPFKQYCLVNGSPIEVCRSHWVGSFSNGKFDASQGRLTNKLGTMILKLVERFGHKGNWRNYTYVDEMRGTALVNLSQVGLQFNEAKSQNPFAYYTAAANNSFTRILNFEKRNQDIRDDILIQNGYLPSFSRQLAHEDEIRKLRENAEDDSGNYGDF